MPAAVLKTNGKKPPKAVRDAMAKPLRGAVGTLAHGPERHDDTVEEGSFTLQDDESDAAVADAAERALEALAIPLDDIVRSPHNTRKTFDPASISSLAESMRQVGQTTMCEVLPAFGGKYELVDGERRYRAAREAGLPTLRCAVRDVGAGNKVEIDLVRLAANRDREDLNPIDEALAFQHFLDPVEQGGHGVSQAELAKRINVSASQISNRVRLLRLPERARGLVISGEMPVEVARELSAWCDIPAVVAEVEKSKAKNWSSRETADILDRLFVKLRFLKDKTIQANKGALLPRSCKQPWGEEFYATGDQDLAKRLIHQQRQAEEAEWARRTGGGAKNAGKVDPKAAKAKQEAIQRKRLYRYVAQWHHMALLARLREGKVEHKVLWRWVLFFSTTGNDALGRGHDVDTLCGVKETPLQPTRLRGLAKLDLDQQVNGLVLEWVEGADVLKFHSPLDAGDVVEMAKQAGIDFEAEWRIDDAFLGLHNADTLADLWVELGFQKETKTSIPSGAKRAFAVAQFVAAIAKQPEKKRPFPKCLRNVQPVSLT